MTRLTWLALLATGCTVPIELVDSDGMGGTGSGQSDGAAESGSDGDGAEASDGGTDNPPICEVGTEGCPCDEDACDAGLACEESVCVPLAGNCGNGTVDPGEDCDDGNLTDADGCNADCRLSGDLEWTMSFRDGEQGSRIDAVAVSSVGSIIIAGRDSNFDLSAGWVSAFDPSIQPIWMESLPVDTFPNDLALGTDDGIFVGCSFFVEGGFGGFGSYWAREYGSNGTEGETFEENWDPIEGVAVTADGTRIAGGSSRVYAHGSDQSWYWETNEWVVAMASTPDGGFVVATGIDVADSQVFKFGVPTPDAGPLWVIEGSAQPADVAVDSAGNIILVGKREYQDNETGWLRKIAPDGTEVWLSEIDFGEHTPVALAVDTHDRIVVARETTLGYKLEKYDVDGTLRWSAPSAVGPRIRDIATNAEDEIFAVGFRPADSGPPTRAWMAGFSP